MTDIRRIICPNVGLNEDSIHASYDLETLTGVLTIQSKHSDSTHILNSQRWQSLLDAVGANGSFLEHIEALDLSQMPGSIYSKLTAVSAVFERSL
jgi:hypothetical protein